MKRTRIPVKLLALTIVIMLVAAMLCGGAYLVKSKQVFPNDLFVSESDTIGVDISEYQADVDMETLRGQGISFVYVKATEGATHNDSRFQENWANAKAAGMPVGAYHFFSYDSSGADQARHFIDVVGDIDGCLVPVVDVEYYGDKEENPPAVEDVQRELASYLQALEMEYDVKPIIYTEGEIYDKYLKGAFDDYGKWIRSVYYPVIIDYRGDWLVWQYKDRGVLAGYSGGERFIDLNVLNSSVSLDDLKA